MRKKSRIVSFLLAAALCLGVMAPAFAATTKFADVPTTHWAAADIDYVVNKGLFSGTSATTFSPDGKITQGQMAVVLGRYAGQDVDNCSPWYQKGMDWAIQDNILPNNEYRGQPSHQLTRTEFATMMYNFARNSGRDTVNCVQDAFILDNFIDGTLESGNWVGNMEGYNAMRWAVSIGLITGTDATHLSPKNLVIRAQVATMLARYDRRNGQTTPTPTPAPTQPSATVPRHQRVEKAYHLTGIPGPKPALDSTVLIPESDISVSSGLLKNGKPATPENVIEAMKEIEKLYPTGTLWTDPRRDSNTVYNPYYSECDDSGDGACKPLRVLLRGHTGVNGGVIDPAYGCGAFAAMVSYMIFPNDAECREVTDMSKVRPGDIVFDIREDGSVSHVWVATSNSWLQTYNDGDTGWMVKCAQGNFGNIIDWGDKYGYDGYLYTENDRGPWNMITKVYTRYPD